MQASLDAYALKPFTRALTCLSKYGDDLTIFATPENLSLSATNSSQSAYCRVRYARQFFSRFNVGKNTSRRGMDEEAEEAVTVTGQLLTKSLLSILKHRTVEKSVERCDLSIVEGVLPNQDSSQPSDDDEERDSLESRLIVRLHCKHGVVKTHRLLLLVPTALLAPSIPDSSYESRLGIGPKAVKDMIEHFPSAKSGGKSDPQLIWSFGDSDIQLRSWETGMDAKGKAQLSTELTISAEEFEVYNIHSIPITIAFHLREFNATVAYAESMTLDLNIRFTDPASPLYIDVEGDNSETLFVISTSEVATRAGARSTTGQQQQKIESVRKKRVREEDGDEDNDGREDNGDNNERASSRPSEPRREKPKRPMKVTQRADPTTLVHGEQTYIPSSSRHTRGSMAPPSFLQPTQSQIGHREPLFLPGSQLSIPLAASQAIKESGLGIETMDADEFIDMLEGDGEEVGFDFRSQRVGGGDPEGVGSDAMMEQENGRGGEDSFDVIEEMEMGATQIDTAGSKTFKPLFED